MNQIIEIDTITSGHNFLGLPKPKHPLVSVFKHGVGELRSQFDHVTLRLNLYQVMYKDGMEGSMGYGRNSYDFTEGSLIFTKPGQTITLGNYDEGHNPNGWSLLFHPDLIRKSPLGKTIEHYNFFSYDVNEALHVSEDEKNALLEILGKIEQEYHQNLDQHSQKLIVSNIELLLDYSTRYYDRQFFTRSNLHKDIVIQFEELLKDYYQAGKAFSEGIPSVTYCGDELHMSPKYLSDLLKKETGKSAQEHIHSYVVDKAKTQLLGSMDAISQIAYDLGFEYPQHFSKLFKAKTGMSPAQYRNVN